MSTKRHSARNFVNPINRFNSASIRASTGAAKVSSIGLLVVAGGGAGAILQSQIGTVGGGGAGGYLANISYPITPDTTYTVTVGAGGGPTPGFQGNDGSNSWFQSNIYIAYGGGGGGTHKGPYGTPTGEGRPGGSGGGGGAAQSAPNGTAGGLGGSGTPGQGNAGGQGAPRNGDSGGSGGGGGAGGAGTVGTQWPTMALGGPGGNGLQWYNGNYYSGGGGGCGREGSFPTSYPGFGPAPGGLGGGGNGSVHNNAGTALFTSTKGNVNTGGGGGGAMAPSGPAGGNVEGGSGIIIVHHPTAFALASSFPGATSSTYLGNIYYTFTTSGSIMF